MEPQGSDDSYTLNKYFDLRESFSEPTTPLLNGFIIRNLKCMRNQRMNVQCKRFAKKHYFMKGTSCQGAYFKKFVEAVSDLFHQLQGLLRFKKTVRWSEIVELFNTPFAFQPSPKCTSFKQLYNENLALKALKPLEEARPSVSQDGWPEATSTCKENQESNFDLNVEGKLENSSELRKEICPMCDRRNKKILKRKKWIEFLTNKCDPSQLPNINTLRTRISRADLKIEALKLKIKAKFDNEQERHQLEIEPLAKELKYLQDSYAEMQVKYQNVVQEHQEKQLEAKSELSCSQTEVDMLRVELARAKAENKLLLRERERVIEQYEVLVLEGATDSESD
ncbi:uncharacterized protein LOC131953284 [Physella acuta]|uniref:uncharacterized protein LOC131953284 n=1 Tax=Physella acuta TaxID=109671 RepID=UPI0027DC8F74|nr:uncharacterized protein LOC131953284 [Physella acuta]XP_059172388.1 uncharacterized protein LOC131953284 [Physella acuta]XP_059172389.1 uncharacterized protein LOC131953284 [Physella acuta]